MINYKKIIAAVDLSEEGEAVMARALSIAKASDATLMLLHVIEPIGYAYGGDIPLDIGALQLQMDQTARAQLAQYGEKFGVAKAHQQVAIGRPETEIHRLAEDQGADLIVVGSHGRHGIQLLLGSTANGVLHGAKCDVLAVRIK